MCARTATHYSRVRCRIHFIGSGASARLFVFQRRWAADTVIVAGVDDAFVERRAERLAGLDAAEERSNSAGNRQRRASWAKFFETPRFATRRNRRTGVVFAVNLEWLACFTVRAAHSVARVSAFADRTTARQIACEASRAEHST